MTITIQPVNPAESPDSNKLANEIYANTYFSHRLEVDPWDDASNANKTKALEYATTLIRALKFRGNVLSGEDDEVIPVALQNACCELALRLLDEYDPGEEADTANIRNQGFAGSRTTYGDAPIPRWVVANIPSPIAWTLIAPWLENSETFGISRV